MMKPKLSVYLSDHVAERLNLAAKRPGTNRSAIVENAPPEALSFYDELADVFVEHAVDDVLDLLPGQAYFLAPDLPTLNLRIRHELLPLLDDYLRQGLLGPATAELQAIRDRFEDRVN